MASKTQTEMIKNPPVASSSEEESGSSESSDDDQSEPMETNGMAPPAEAETETETEKKPQMFQRLFTQKDELVLLKGIQKVISKSEDSSLDMDALLDHMKEELSFNASKAQLVSKVKRMRSRFYKKSCGKGNGGADHIVFSNEFDKNVFQLSREIWGDKPSTSLDELVQKSEIPSFLYAEKCISWDEPKLHACWDMIPDGPKKREMEARFKSIKASQADICLSRTRITTNAAEVVLKD